MRPAKPVLTLLVFCIAPATWSAPICVPAHPLPRAELAPEYVAEEHMKLQQLKRLAAKGNADALNMLGVRYGTGNGAPLDPEKSFQYYKKAAELGLPIGQSNLAYMYQSGEGTEQNLELAWQWALKAKDQGHFRAQAILGEMLSEGEGVDENPREAAFCYLLSARQGYVPAQFTMAQLYERGLGVLVDVHEAIRWWTRAQEAKEGGKPWVDETPLTEFPDEWTPRFKFKEELAADSLVRTTSYSFRVKAPPSAPAESKWALYIGMIDPRGTVLAMELDRYVFHEVRFKPHGKLTTGESVSAAAQRLRPGLNFRAATRAECATMSPEVPSLERNVATLIAFCVHPADREVYELSVSRLSMAFEETGKLEDNDRSELAAGLRLMLDTFRFE